MIPGRRTSRSTVALRIGACAVAVLLASAAQAEGPGKPIAPARATEGIYAVVSAAAGAAESAELRVPIFTLTLPPPARLVPAIELGAHMTVANQPRASSAIIFSTRVPF